MTVGELICKLKEYSLGELGSFFSKKGDEEYVRLVSWGKDRVFLPPHGERRLTKSELITQLEQYCSVESKVFFLTQANEVAPINIVELDGEGSLIGD